MILNLKEFNKFTERIHFKMETLQQILYLIDHNFYMSGIYLEDAFLTVPMSLKFAKLLKFKFEGQIFMYICLPFRFRDSPRIFTKILKPVISHLRNSGHILTFYLDDSWQAAQTFAKAIETCKATYSLLLKVGFLPNLKKSQLFPSHQIQILGTCLDSEKIIPSLPKEEEVQIVRLLKEALNMHSMSIKHLAKIIGKLLSCIVVCPFGQLHYRYLERSKLRALRLNKGHWSSKCRLHFMAKLELQWWIENLPNTSAPIHRKNPGPVIFCDASSRGWGCYFEGKFANGHFSQAEHPFSINTKETLAILYGVKSFLHCIKNKTVMILSDNTTAISCVRKMGGMDSELRSKIVSDLWDLAQTNNIWFEISHIPGIFNTESDWASHNLSERLTMPM